MLYKNNHKMNPAMLKSTSQTSSAPNEQQMLAQALRGMPQQQLSEEEKMMIMQLMQQGMTQEQAMQELMRMKSVG